jgi:hypothetical protein
MMKRFLTFGLAALACVGLALSGPATATSLAITGSQPTVTHFGVADATANYTNSTTTPSDIAAATITVPKTNRSITGNQGNASGVTQMVKVCYSADAGKVTSTTGTITVLVNGVSLAVASRTIGIMRGTLAACALVARPVATSFVVKLQGVSGDTAAFTVYNATMSVEVLYFA